MYCGPAAVKLLGWLTDAGFTEEDFGTTVYLTALTKCFPGRAPGSSKDRAPSVKERANCRPWLDEQQALVRPRVVILFGKMAIDTYLPKLSLNATIGKVFEIEGIPHLPLPHSSGASLWLNDNRNQALLAQAIERLRELRILHTGTRQE